jgi:superfamily II DNA or RNA helicase
MVPTNIQREHVKDAILVASYGTFSTGVNVKRLHHLVFASPSKSRYRVLQSIGRGLRLHASKRVVYVMDIVDDAHDRKYVNYAFKHWGQRAKFYTEEAFPVELYTHEFVSEGV